MQNELYALFVQQGLGWTLRPCQVPYERIENAVDLAISNGWSLQDAVERGECKILSINLADGIFARSKPRRYVQFDIPEGTLLEKPERPQSLDPFYKDSKLCGPFPV